VTVDIPLKGDPEISRIHAHLGRDEQGQFWLTPKGRNSTLIGGREVTREERAPVGVDERIEICSYTLRIQPQ
jgi:predicted component of type VI protein secretion system